MAADTRDPNSSSQTYPSTSSAAAAAATQDDGNLKTYEQFGTSPRSNYYASNNNGGGEAVEAARPQNANLLPGGMMNTAGGNNIRETSILEAAKTIKLRDFKELHKKPCARDSFLVGIGAGFGVGGIRAIIGGWFFFFSPSSPFFSILLFFFFFNFIFTWFFLSSSLTHSPYLGQFIYIVLTASTREQHRFWKLAVGRWVLLYLGPFSCTSTVRGRGCWRFGALRWPRRWLIRRGRKGWSRWE